MVTGWAASGCKEDCRRRLLRVFGNWWAILALPHRRVPRKRIASRFYFRCSTVLLLCLAVCGVYLCFCCFCFLFASSFNSPFHEHGVIQAAQSEWERLASSARQHGRVWFKDKLQQFNVYTLRQYVKDASVSLGRNPRKESCIAALLDKEFPVAPQFLHIISFEL